MFAPIQQDFAAALLDADRPVPATVTAWTGVHHAKRFAVYRNNVVTGLVRTADAVTPMPGLVYPMIVFALLYIGLALVVTIVMRSIVRETT